MYPLRMFVGGFRVKVSLNIAAVSEHFLCNNHNATTYMQIIPLKLVQSNLDSVQKAREAYFTERGQTLEPHDLNKKEARKPSTFLYYKLFMFRPFVHLQVFITTFQAVTFPLIFKFLHFYVTFSIDTYYLAVSLRLFLLFIFSLVISHFPYNL